ncbi:hypothetical protein CFC21_005282 [Triticum aestivum]|uniref:DUF4378 domain-containing protein n=2 Tax=Triticum aestivum TaxID=4565 RepID=A0A9R1IP00_WHEAT|nr:hypothetical protein CFC21_005282 [Triticum aestivum]
MSIPFGRDSISHSISLLSLKESRSLWTSLLPLYQIIKREEEGLSTGVIPRKEIVPSILEFVVKLTFIHLSWTSTGKRQCLEQEMEAWVEEAVNESSKAIDWLYSDSFDFDFLFFGCERSESTAGEESSDDN